MNRPLRSYSPFSSISAAVDDDVVDEQLLLRGQLVEVEAERPDVRGQLVGRLLEGHEHAGLALNSMAPRTRNSMASSVLPQPALPQTSVGRAQREAAAGDLIQALDSGWRLA